MTPTKILALAVVALPTFAACSSESSEAAHKAPPTAEKLEPYECGSITRMHTLGGVFLASQPSPDDFQQAKDAGIKTVVNLRLADENQDFDEPALIAELGLDYANPGFSAPDSLTDEIFEATRELLSDEAKRPMLVHCKSANRVGAVWLAHRVLDGGLGWAEALSEAKTVGLKLPAYEALAKAYVDRQQAGG